MADSTASLDVVINAVNNTAGFAQAKAELSALAGGGFSPIGGGTVNFGGSLTQEEQAMARAQLSTKELTVAERDLSAEGNAVARAFGSMGVQGAEAGGRLAALGGVMSSNGALGIGLGATIVGIGALYEASKSMIDNADKNEESNKGLNQALQTQGLVLTQMGPAIDNLISKNSKYIDSEYDAKDALAEALRAGNDWNDSVRLFNDALDLAALKHVSLSDAMSELIRAENGNAVALRDLGISSKTTTDVQKELASAQSEVAKATKEHSNAVYELQLWEDRHRDRSKLTAADLLVEGHLKDNVRTSTKNLSDANNDLSAAQSDANDKGSKSNQILDQVEKKAGGAHQTVSDLKQSQNDLNLQWQKFSDQYGPGVSKGLADVFNAADDVVGITHSWFDFLSNDTEPVFAYFSSNLVGLIQDWQGLTKAIGDAIDKMNVWAGLPAGGQTGPHYRTPGPTSTSGQAPNKKALPQNRNLTHS